MRDANNLLTMPPALPAAQLRLSRRHVLAGLAAALAPVRANQASALGLYPWRQDSAEGVGTLAARFAPPPGFERIPQAPDSFAAWLRGLPLLPAGAPVHLHTGGEKRRQDVHAGVIAIDVGQSDLQQCADAIMRLRAEWLFASGRANDIAFTVTGGGRVAFSRWAKGERPSASGKKWTAKSAPDASYAALRKYLDFVFAYAGTASLEKELVAIADPAAIAIGDVFIKGGFPGHAVLVADMAEHATTKAKRFLLLQSYMPAQEMHVLVNPANPDASPWYGLPAADLVTPEWTFAPGALRRWP